MHGFLAGIQKDAENQHLLRYNSKQNKPVLKMF